MGTKLHRRYTFLFTNHDPHEDAHKTCKYIHHPTYMQILPPTRTFKSQIGHIIQLTKVTIDNPTT
jgi:hypothetical protein